MFSLALLSCLVSFFIFVFFCLVCTLPSSLPSLSLSSFFVFSLSLCLCLPVMLCCVVCVLLVVVCVFGVRVWVLRRAEKNGKTRMWIPTRLCVYVQNVSVCTGTTRTCVSACTRGAGTHGDVLNAHTGAFWMDTRRSFSAPHHTTHTAHQTPHQTQHETQHKMQHHTQHHTKKGVIASSVYQNFST